MKQREIKFRAWVNNLMVFVYVLDQTGNAGRGTHFEKSKGYSDSDGQIVFNIDNAILMQFTGLLDKNGIPIYEGDVVSTNIDDPDKIYLRTIVWDTGAFMVKQIHGSANYWLWSHKFETCPMNLVVVGNIYQTPDLLK